jgi:hypothetical protein
MRIEFARGSGEKLIPLQRVTTVYRRDGEGVEKVSMGGLFVMGDDVELFVSHFETCPHADEFSKEQRPRPPGPKDTRDGKLPERTKGRGRK